MPLSLRRFYPLAVASLLLAKFGVLYQIDLLHIFYLVLISNNNFKPYIKAVKAALTTYLLLKVCLINL